MATNLNALRALLGNREQVSANAWALVRALSGVVNADTSYPNGSRETQELVLRALEQREAFGPFSDVLDSIAQKQGLYPYIDPRQLGLPGLLAYEAHRPPNLDEVVFHRAQIEVYGHLMNGENVVLSAPTSFGKSILIDAVIASGRYRNVVVVVPTIALIDETRRRLIARFGTLFKVVTHISQGPSEKNIFVFTQERALEYSKFPELDLFVIDEFYKLDPRRDPDRAFLLNQAFYRFQKTGAQFYMLGPNIRQLPLDLPSRLRFRFIATDYQTVVSEIIRVQSSKDERLEILVRLAKDLHEPTLIYCASPASARRVATALVGAMIDESGQGLEEAATWIGHNFHPDWIVGRALRHRIGIHHGRVPRAVAQYVVRSFNAESLRYLVCTSTLIEGVNTKAKNVIVYDNRVATRHFDFFTFNNIRGRSGRMFEHFVGRAYLFNDPPPEELPQIDVPAFTQSLDTPESVLIQLDASDLTERSQERIQPLVDQQHLGVDVIRSNRGIDPGAQIRLATYLELSSHSSSELLAWNRLPSYEQLLGVCELVWQHLLSNPGMQGGVSSGRQLAFKLKRYWDNPSIHALILKELASQSELDLDADRAVEEVLEFVRYWPTFLFPRLLIALERIQQHVLGRLGLPYGNYGYFAGQMENQFLPAGIAALEEYGLPVQMGMKIAPELGYPGTLDEALLRLHQIKPQSLDGLTLFEKSMLIDTIQSI